MITAGLIAKKGRALGLKRKPLVKTSLAPGSMVVTEYLKNSNLLKPMEELGFHNVGYGCATCIGNSGPLIKEISDGIKENDHAYFVHSYQLKTANKADLLATVDYGGIITAAVARENIIGTQFHPEKSQSTGLRLISNFLSWKP